MFTPAAVELKTASSDETYQLGKELALVLRGGEVIFLVGELGSGKTTFAQGVAQGLGVKELLRSASFVILWESNSGRLPLYHLDLYRLTSQELNDLGLEEYFYGSGVTLVEWAEKIKEFSGNYLKLSFFLGEETNERLIKIGWQGKEWGNKVKQWIRKK